MDGNNIQKKFNALLFICILFLNLLIFFSPEVIAPNNSSNTLGYELLDNNTVLRIWNQFDSYYFNVSNGIQFTNHYKDYWAKNVMMLGYYSGDEWILVYRTDELSGFNKTIDLSEDFCNATIWKDLFYSGYSFRLAIRYCLGIADSNLTVIPYIKNLGDPIPFTLGFGWELKDIKINMQSENNFIEINDTEYSLSGDLNNSYKNLTKTFHDYNPDNHTWNNYSIPYPKYVLKNDGYYLYLEWNKDLNYLVTIKNRSGQYNAPVTLFIKIGSLAADQEKYTSIYWFDSTWTLIPESDSYNDGFTSTGSTVYEVIDDTPFPDNDSSYIYGSDGYKRAAVNVPDRTTQHGSITKVRVYIRARHSYSTTGTYCWCLIRIGDTNYLGTQETKTTTWQDFHYDWLTNPATASAWTWDDIDDLLIGEQQYQSSGTGNGRCTQVYAEVSYNPYPEIETIAAEGVEETNATLKGYVIYDNETDVSTFFQYGLSTSSYTTTSKQYPKSTGDYFSLNKEGLLPGSIYYFRAALNNTADTVYGENLSFTTKPEAPTSLSATPENNTINLSWTKGLGSEVTGYTYIERNATAVTSWNKGEGTLVYNGTGSYYVDSDLSNGTKYYYQTWSFNNSLFSDNKTSVNQITYPDPPGNYDGYVWTTYINVSWTAGLGADTTMLRKKSGDYPSSITDGTLCQNSSLTYYNESRVNSIFYSLWSYNNTLKVYSQKVDYAYGGLLVNCYDEIDNDSLTFDISVVNQDGSETYTKTSCTNPEVIDVNLCPHGIVSISVSADGYLGRTYYKEMYSGNWYYLDAYLPRENPNGTGGDCSLHTYIDSVTIPNKNNDVFVNLTYDLEDMISVEIYNSTLYGTYGGWYFISATDYNFTSSQVIINKSVLWTDSKIARVSYYYLYCPGDLETALYYLRVVETISTDYSSYDKAVENAFVEIKRYIEAAASYEIVSSLYTDANGYVNLYLIPEITYKVFISKEDYNNTVSDYIPPQPNQYGQTTEKWFRLVRYYEEPPIAEHDTLWTNITWSIEPNYFYHNTSFYVYFNITSINSKIEYFNAYLYVYDSENLTWILLDSDNKTTSSGGSISFNVPNIVGKYSFVAGFKKTNFSYYTFGASDGCRFFYINLEPLRDSVMNIPDIFYIFIMIFLMIAAVAFLVKFGAGAISGVGGLGVMGFMLALKPELTIGSPGVSAWWLFLATCIVYLIILFLSRGKT